MRGGDPGALQDARRPAAVAEGARGARGRREAPAPPRARPQPDPRPEPEWSGRASGKLYRARSRLYRSDNLPENIRWKALDEIYKIYMLLHRSDLKIQQTFFHNFAIFC